MHGAWLGHARSSLFPEPSVSVATHRLDRRLHTLQIPTTMTILNLCSPLRTAVALVVVATSVLAAPVLADAIAGCIMPLLPKSDELTEQAWEPRDLLSYLGETASLEFESPNDETISVIPHYTIRSREQDRRPIVTGEGTAFKISPGRHPMGIMLQNDTAARVSEALSALEDDMRMRPPYQVRSAHVLDHDERLPWTRNEEGTVALTFNVSDAKPRRGQEPTRSHMLVLFIGNAANAGNAGNADD